MVGYERAQTYGRGKRTIVALIACGVAVAVWVHLASAGGKARVGVTTRHRLLRVVLYTYGEDTGRTCLDFQRRSLECLGRFRSGDYVDWCTLATTVATSEAQAVRRALTEANLRDFRPNASWFDAYDMSRFGVRDGGADLDIVWEDRSVALSLPPPPVCSRLSKDARRRYKHLGEAARLIAQMKAYYAKKTKLSPIPDWRQSPEMKRMHAEMQRLHREALPKGRVGW